MSIAASSIRDFNLSGFWAVGILDCRDYRLSGFWAVGILGCRDFGSRDSGCRDFGCPDSGVNPVVLNANYFVSLRNRDYSRGAAFIFFCPLPRHAVFEP